MTKNKTREGPLPPADKGVNDARPGLPTPTVRKDVTWVQPEPTTSDITRPQQLGPDTTWAEPSIAKSKLAKRSPTCEGCCKGDVSSISCNESTPHTLPTFHPLRFAFFWQWF